LPFSAESLLDQFLTLSALLAPSTQFTSSLVASLDHHEETQESDNAQPKDFKGRHSGTFVTSDLRLGGSEHEIHSS